MSELILKTDDAFRVASRHFIHTMNSHLDRADKEMETLREEASEEVDRATLEKAYPVDLFSRNAGNLDAVEEHAARIAENGESYRAMALEMQAEVTRVLLQIEADIAEHKGLSQIVDHGVDILLTEMFALLDVPTFLNSSIQRRSDRVQALLDSPTPSKFASLVGVDFTQKAAVTHAVETLQPKITEAEEDGSIAEMNWESEVDATVEQVLNDDLMEEAEQRIKDAFVDNEARTQVLTVVMDKVGGTLMDKVCPKVYDELSADNPALQPA